MVQVVLAPPADKPAVTIERRRADSGRSPGHETGLAARPERLGEAGGDIRIDVRCDEVAQAPPGSPGIAELFGALQAVECISDVSAEAAELAVSEDTGNPRM